jgi:uncharacterized protein YjbJ (UPF0337 family)
VKDFNIMHKDQIKGAAKDIAGATKQGIGKATGNERLEAEGVAERVEGKVQKAAGEVKDTGKKVLSR